MTQLSHRCLSVSLCVLLSGVVSVSFEEDAEGNVSFIAYPLQCDPEADLENKNSSVDCEPKSEMLMGGKIMDSKNDSTDGQSHCTDKDKG